MGEPGVLEPREEFSKEGKGRIHPELPGEEQMRESMGTLERSSGHLFLLHLPGDTLLKYQVSRLDIQVHQCNLVNGAGILLLTFK